MDGIVKIALRWAWQNTRSWRTTAVAAAQLLTGLALLAGYLASDSSTPDDATVESVRGLAAWLLLITGAGSWMARDATVSSDMTKIE